MSDVILTPLFGYVDLRSWIEVQGEELVGMGSKTVYDQDGKVIEHQIEPTGVTAGFC